jgi:hypothetical protein
MLESLKMSLAKLKKEFAKGDRKLRSGDLAGGGGRG